MPTPVPAGPGKNPFEINMEKRRGNRFNTRKSPGKMSDRRDPHPTNMQ